MTESKLERNMRLIQGKGFDRFDQLVIIEGWFEKFSAKRQKNLLKILQGKINQ